LSNYLLSILVEAKDEASGALGSIGDALGGLGRAGLAVVGGGLLALGGALAASVSNAMEAQDVFAQTEAVVKSTGGAAGMSARQMGDLASSLSAAAGKSAFGDEMILQGENVLATFTNIGKNVFPLATQASLDMAQALHSTPEAMSMMLGKALSSAEGVSALRKQGVQFTEAQQEVIKKLFATGHAAEAQKIILGELAHEFGGSAVAAAQTFSGQLGTLKDKFGELLEGIGTKLLPILTKFVGYLNSPEIQAGIQAFADALMNGIGQAATFIGPILAQLGPLLAGAFQFFTTTILPMLLGLWGQLQAGFVAAQPIFAALVAAVRPVIASFLDAKNPVDGLIAALARISPTFALVKAGIDAAIGPIKAIVLSVFGIIQGFLHEHGAKIHADVAGVWQQIQTIINQVIPPIQAIIRAIFGAVASFLHEHGAEIQAFIATTWDTIASIIHIALDLIQATIVPILVSIAGFISSHGTQIQAILTGVWNTIKAVINIALGLIKGILQTALALIKGDWQGAWNAIKTMASTVWENLKTIFSTALAAIKAVLVAAWNSIKTTVTTGLAAIKLIFTTVWDAIKVYFEGLLDGLVGWVVQTFVGIGNAIRMAASGLMSAAGAVADGIISGIAHGIENGASAIIDAAKNAAMAALDAAKHALGISSPSKLFQMEIGHNIARGMALGIEGGTPLVSRAATRLAGAVTAGASSTTNTTYNLNYSGVHQDEQDVRQALRAQALLTGSITT
jgi:phage-related protein